MAERTCAVCSKTFTPKYGLQRACSMSCAVSLGHRSRKRRPRTVCPVCGKTNVQPRSVFCSRDCMFKARRKTCNVPACGEPSESRLGMCGTHARRFMKDHPLTGLRFPIAEGERRVYGNGYVWLKVGGRLVMEHVHVMEQAKGRCLEPGENVHHKNGIKADNRPANLELWVKVQPGGQRVADLVAFVVEHYPAEVRQALASHGLCGEVAPLTTDSTDRLGSAISSDLFGGGKAARPRR